jgi:hypothetical protein
MKRLMVAGIVSYESLTKYDDVEKWMKINSLHIQCIIKSGTQVHDVKDILISCIKEHPRK